MTNRANQIVALGTVILAVAPWLAAPPARALDGDQRTTIQANPAPTPEQLQALIARAVENQHRDDRALEEYERVERVVTRKPDGSAAVVTDRTDRVLPSGTGTMKLPLAENGAPVSPELYRHWLQIAVDALNIAVHPNEDYKRDMIKFQKRRRERSDLVDSASHAFHMKWAGRETLPDPAAPHGSRTLAKILLDPDPSYIPTSRFATAFGHAHATLWVDESEAQFVRLEGDITSDISFGAGIAGKVYRGGHFLLEQSEVGPGVWLPTLYTYDVDGRKFLFGFDVHERTEVSRYRHVGPPSQSIEIIRAELNNTSAESPARELSAK
ncbi:MAG: hypothetical protein LAO19_08715 [Acidobacteriia bacterium]|nr:hypothetical protein [Terriglobia bacterium]